MNFYLSKYSFRPAVLSVKPNPELGVSIVIPCFDEPDIIPTFEALKACELPKCAVEVILVINSGEHHPQRIKIQNKKTLKQAQDWIDVNSNSRLNFQILFTDDLPKKHAGVGLARKLGMDEAVYRFHQLDHDGIIVCFDADSQCDPNYLIEIEKHFLKHPKSPGCSVHYEHPLEGNEFSAEVYEGIVNYELHLRYYNQALKYADLPYAFHTVGSSMAVRSSAYQKQGGMNKRKAGEDFYFIHKIIALGGFTELKTTRVIPSPRISDRVPFGTGKAIGDWIKSEKSVYDTYAFANFQFIKAFVACIPFLQDESIVDLKINLSEKEKQILINFLLEQKFEDVLVEIRKNSKTQEAFVKRFFHWFDAFKVLKLVHFLRDAGMENQPIFTQTAELLNIFGSAPPLNNTKEQLTFLRDLEKK